MSIVSGNILRYFYVAVPNWNLFGKFIGLAGISTSISLQLPIVSSHQSVEG